MRAESGRKEREREGKTQSSLAERWLKQLDAKARRLPRARSWLSYPWFLLVRYPRLRPDASRPGLSPSPGIPRDPCALTLDQELITWETKVLRHESASRALVNLSTRQRRELIALLIDTTVSLDEYRSHSRWHRRIRKLAQEEPRRHRMLESKLQKAHRSLDKLLTAHDIDAPGHILESAFKRARQSKADLDAYRKALDVELSLNQYFENGMPSSQDLAFLNLAAFVSDPSSHSVRVNPVSSSMVHLYAYFIGECGLSRNVAEVRVALLRNAFWTRYGVSEVPVSIRYNPVTCESAGCPAVKAAVRHWARRHKARPVNH